jgi:hypothetical protein
MIESKELTRQQLCDKYQISRTTLWRWFCDYQIYDKLDLPTDRKPRVFTPNQYDLIIEILG